MHGDFKLNLSAGKRLSDWRETSTKKCRINACHVTSLNKENNSGMFFWRLAAVKCFPLVNNRSLFLCVYVCVWIIFCTVEWGSSKSLEIKPISPRCSSWSSLQFPWAPESPTLGWVCWDIHSREDCGIIFTQTRMLQSSKLPKRFLLSNRSHSIKCFEQQHRVHLVFYRAAQSSVKTFFSTRLYVCMLPGTIKFIILTAS